MTPAEWRRIEELFQQTKDRTRAERRRFLDETCPDQLDVRAEVESLLRAHEQQDSPLDTPGAAPDPQIDGYRILDVLGVGGMGTVYLAEQREPVRRRVAIKVIKLGMDSRAVLRRFEVERQALALMNHENIARVLDAGTTEKGQPYFVMEHVPGLPITAHCDRSRLDTDERVALFEQVCAGVQHAHQKGVIHRDIKPSNVLVTVDQGRAIPKIIDFGLARATDHRLLEATVYTEHGLTIGTPEYMSPEQAEMSSQDIDTRTDVYSLGVVLYELLVGALPLSPEELRSEGLAAIQRRIREEDPPRPSTRLSTLGPGSEHAARLRKTTVAALGRELRGDLDWITMKALAKDRNRRYATAAALAEDLARHLQHEPVEAGPPGAGYRARKFLRRYRTQVVAGAAVFVTLVAGLVGISVFALEASAAADDAERQRTVAQTKIDQFNMLAMLVRLDEVRQEEERLYPAWPDQVSAMRGWLRDRAAPLIASLPRLRSTVLAHQERAVPWSPDEQEESRRTHPRFEELRAKQLKLAALRRTQAVRAGQAEVADVVLSATTADRTAAELNDEAWPLVDPQRTAFGDEARGLALARLAHARAEGELAAIAGDTLAWALFANGLDDAALAASSAALDAVGEDQKPVYEKYLQTLQAAIENAPGECDATAREVAALEAEVDRRRSWRFEHPEDQFLHDALTRGITGIEAFETDDVPRVESDLAWSERVGELTVRRYAREWVEVRQAVLTSEKYRAHPIDLQPQLGLVPIGRNPETGLYEFYHLRSAAEGSPIPVHGDGGRIDVGEDTGIVFALIPGGAFLMGAQGRDPEQPNYFERAVPKFEEPVHEVVLAPFFIARHEMSQAQWRRLSGGAEPSLYGPRHDERLGRITLTHPVEQVSWRDCNRLLGQHGLTLPTEAQWEFAARAGTTTPWWTGAERESLIGAINVRDESLLAVSPERLVPDWPGFDDGWVVHAPVGALRPNGFGLHSVHGNVWEWCLDLHGGYDVPVVVGTGLRIVAHDEDHNHRGGSFQFGYEVARSSYRSTSGPDFRGGDLGLRAARALR